MFEVLELEELELRSVLLLVEFGLDNKVVSTHNEVPLMYAIYPPSPLVPETFLKGCWQ